SSSASGSPLPGRLSNSPLICASVIWRSAHWSSNHIQRLQGMNKKSTDIVDKWGYGGYKKTRRSGFFYVTTDYSAAASAFDSERSTSSMYAIGALSRARKPHFRMRV